MITRVQAFRVEGVGIFETEEQAERYDAIKAILDWFNQNGIELENHEAVHIIDNYETPLRILSNYHGYLEGYEDAKH